MIKHRIGRRLSVLVAVPAILLLYGSTCPPPNGSDDPDPTPDPPPATFSESEPNNTPDLLSAVALDAGDHVRFSGSISESGDIDLYDLGALAAGDRISVQVTADETQLDATVAIFDLDADQVAGNLFVTQDDDPSGLSLSPHIEEVVRHSADRYLLGIAANYGTLLETGDYTIDVLVERGGTAPSPSPQTVYVNFEGGSATSTAGMQFTIDAFDPAEIDPGYNGQDSAVKSLLLETLRENFADYNVTILSSEESNPPADATTSIVHVGQVADTESIAGAEGLGFAIDGVDDYNANPGDQAVIFVNNFTGDIFGLLQALEPQQLAVALANVASHEIGHLLGLNHTFDPASPMNTLDAAGTLLNDQLFKRSLISFSIFDPLNNVLHHNSDLLLRETVGGVVRIADATLAVDELPLSVTAADMDGDGDPDLLVANRSTQTVSVLTNDGNAGYAISSFASVTGGPIDVRTLDLDADGDLDAAVSMGDTMDIGLLINDGTGVLTQDATTVALEESPFGIDSADLDNDGDLDIASTVFFADKVATLINDQNGGLTVDSVKEVGVAPRVVKAADLDGDDVLDIVVSNTDDKTISLLYGLQEGGYEDAVTVSGSALPIGVDVADLNDDGRNDIVVTSGLPNALTVQFITNVSVFLNEGDRVFATGRDYFVGAFAQSVAAEDLDGDGDIDLAVACGGDLFVAADRGRLSLLFNRGDGTFGQSVDYLAGLEPIMVIAEDLNGDGAADLVCVNSGSNDISVFLNQGDGSFGTTLEDTDSAKLLRASRPVHFHASTLSLPYTGFEPRLPSPRSESYCVTCRKALSKMHKR